jgi:CRISPR/Cas system-associated exonuclease Cas4 (RecB family)
MSRFLTQLKYNQAINPVEKTIGFDIQFTNPGIINIEKDHRIMGEIMKYSGTSDGYPYLSPSGINSYLDCSLKFYFRYIAGLKEPDEIAEEIDFQIFGNILHKAVNLLYSSCKGNPVDKEVIGKLIQDQKRIQSVLEQSMVEEFNKSTSTIKNRDFGGRNLVIFEILRKYLNQILVVDMNFIPFEILYLEKKFTTCLYPEHSGQQIAIRLGGTIDRIDQSDGVARIIDYKSGKGDLTYAGMKDLFQKGDPKRNGAVFQTFLYAFLVSSELPDHLIMPGLYYVRHLFKEQFDYQIQCKVRGEPDSVIRDFHQLKDEFGKNLNDLIAEIINPAVPFSQVEDEELCSICPYRKICHR